MDSHLVVFDGDDTLWWTEHLYDDARISAGRIVAESGLDAAMWDGIERELDVENVGRFGLARERFPTSCVEAYDRVTELSGAHIDPCVRSAIWDAADAVFTSAAPVVDGAVRVVLDVGKLARVVVLTKGDPAVQRHRLKTSGLEPLFDGVVIVPAKTSEEFRSLLRAFSVRPQDAWSVGNSWRSDIEPALAAGMRAIWIEAHVWEYERHDISPEEHEAVSVAGSLQEVPEILRTRMGRTDAPASRPSGYRAAIQGLVSRTSVHNTGGPMATSKKDASKAGKLLGNPKTPKTVKSVAGSDLAQAKGKKKGKR